MPKIPKLKYAYDYKFITKIPKGAEYPVPLFFYKFKSPKTNKCYCVHVEIHPHNFYGVKFFLKDHKKDPYKFSINSNLHEARPVIFTCINIMLDIYNANNNASFGFIGSTTKKEVIRKNNINYIVPISIEENEGNTKRYRIYKTLMFTFFSNDYFEHVIEESKSVYLLINRVQQKNQHNLQDMIVDYFNETYEV